MDLDPDFRPSFTDFGVHSGMDNGKTVFLEIDLHHDFPTCNNSFILQLACNIFRSVRCVIYIFLLVIGVLIKANVVC